MISNYKSSEISCSIFSKKKVQRILCSIFQEKKKKKKKKKIKGN